MKVSDVSKRNGVYEEGLPLGRALGPRVPQRCVNVLLETSSYVSTELMHKGALDDEVSTCGPENRS